MKSGKQAKQGVNNIVEYWETAMSGSCWSLSQHIIIIFLDIDMRFFRGDWRYPTFLLKIDFDKRTVIRL